MNKKILFIASVYRHLTAFHIPYMQYFQRHGYEVCAAAGEDVAVREELESLGFRCMDVPFSRSPFDKGNVAAYRQLQVLFQQERFELVHVHTPVAALLARKAFQKAEHGKIVYTAHGFHFYKGAPKQNWLIYYTAEKMAAKWTNHLITINKEDFVNAQKFMPNDKVSYVHGVGVAFESERLSESDKVELKRTLGLSENAVVIAFVAELNANKNHQFLLRNWQRLRERCPQVELLLIGTGELEQSLHAYVLAEQLDGVHFLGYRRDVPALLQISDMVTLLSHREGLPKSIMEAMVEGLPCVVTNTRGLRDLIVRGENGFVVDHGNEVGLVEAFAHLADSAELRESMGEKAKELVKPYLLENVLPEYIRIYERLLK